MQQCEITDGNSRIDKTDVEYKDSSNELAIGSNIYLSI